KRVSSTRFFKENSSPLKKLLFHLGYFFWKTVVLPFLILYHKIDVVICPDYVAPSFGWGRLKLPVFHDAFFWQHEDHYTPRGREYYKALTRWGALGNTIILTTSDYSTACLIEHFGQRRYEVVYQSTEPGLTTSREPVFQLKSKGYL